MTLQYFKLQLATRRSPDQEGSITEIINLIILFENNRISWKKLMVRE